VDFVEQTDDCTADFVEQTDRVHWIMFTLRTGRDMSLEWKDLKPLQFKVKWNAYLLRSLCRMWKSGEGIKECTF